MQTEMLMVVALLVLVLCVFLAFVLGLAALVLTGQRFLHVLITLLRMLGSFIVAIAGSLKKK